MDHVVSEPKAVSILSRAFSRYGWLGFGSQVIVGAIPLVLLIYLFVLTQSKFSPRAGSALVGYMTLAGMLVLALATFCPTATRGLPIGSRILTIKQHW